MAALRRADSSAASPLIMMTPIIMGRGGAFVALGAMGLSLGAAWAWRSRTHEKRITCSVPDGAQALPEQEQSPRARTSPKKNRNKRHKSKAPTAAPAACAAAVPAAEPSVQLPPSVPEEQAQQQQEQARQQQEQPPKQPAEPTPESLPRPLEEEEEEEMMLPAKTLSTASDEPSASETGETYAQFDVEMLEAWAAADATAVSSPGEWIPVGRKQRRRQPSPDFAEPAPTVAGSAAEEQLMAVSPPKSPEPERPADALPSPAESPQPVRGEMPEGGLVAAKKPKKKKKKRRPSPPSLYANEDEPIAAAAAAAADLPPVASEPEMVSLPPVPAPPPAEAWVEVTSRRGKRAAAHEPRASE